MDVDGEGRVGKEEEEEEAVWADEAKVMAGAEAEETQGEDGDDDADEGTDDEGDPIQEDDAPAEGTAQEHLQEHLQKMEDADVEKVGFAKLKGATGVDIEYTVKKYEIFIGRKSKSTPVDVVLGNSMSISRKHAKISYNFETQNWELTVLGKNGVSVGKILYAPSSPPVVLRSQELLQFGDKLEPVSLYFLLPVKA